MVYVREKKVKGRTYYYLVKSVRNGPRVNQVNLEYLGSVKPSVKDVREMRKKYE